MQALIQELVETKKLTKNKVESIKRKYVRNGTLDNFPLNVHIWKACNSDQKEKLRTVLNTKPTRSMAGVSIIAIMPKPNGCPARCTFCPEGKNAPKSYTGF